MTPEELTDREIARFRAELERDLRGMARFLRDQLVKGAPDALEVERVRRTMESLLADYERIFGRAREALREIVAKVLEAVGDDLRARGITRELTTASQTTLVLQMGRGLDDLETLRVEQTGALRAVVTSGLRTGLNPREAFEELVGATGQTVGRVVSLVDTTTMAVDRVAVLEQSLDAGAELFLFDGPMDTLTRPWCADRVGKLFTRAEVDEVANDTGPNPPSAYGGGFNCRHRWVPVPRSEWRRFPRWQGRPYPGGSRALAAA
jgi:hypothetical protein